MACSTFVCPVPDINCSCQLDQSAVVLISSRSITLPAHTYLPCQGDHAPLPSWFRPRCMVGVEKGPSKNVVSSWGQNEAAAEQSEANGPSQGHVTRSRDDEVT